MQWPTSASAKSPVLTLFEVQVIDQDREASTRHWGQTADEADVLAQTRINHLVEVEGFDPDGFDVVRNMYQVSISAAGFLQFLSEHVSQLF